MPYSSFIFDNAITEVIKLIHPRTFLDLGAGAGKYGLLVKEIDLSIESIAVEIEKDFQGVNTRLDKVDARFDKVDSRLDKVEIELSEVKIGLSEVKTEVKWMRDNSGELFAKLDKFITLLEKQ